MSEYKDYGWKTTEFSHAHNYILPALTELLVNKEDLILDVGCGNGSVANHLIKNGYNVYGTDASESGISNANKINPGRFFIQDLSSDGLPSGLNQQKFSKIISTEVIEHLYDPRKYISFCKNVLLKAGGGELIISTPYHGYLKNLVMALTGTLDKHFTVLWDGGHIKFWSKRTLTKILEEQGFQVIDFKGVGRIPYIWKSMLIKAIIK
jgi:2-polyprenyl-3-methyl-5-hydroxy-6-metoxy-1,4-benzoquinol methylase